MGLLSSLPKLPVVGSILLVLCSLFTPTTAYTELGDDALRAIPSGGDDFDIRTGSLLAPILIPRVPGTPGSTKVQQHFVDFFRANLPEWTIEWHNSTSKTPATGDKDIPFTNLIFRRDPPWVKDGEVERLTLVAHYDSLLHPEGFIGAIDSAAPCAMLLQAAKSIEAALVEKWKAMEASGEAGSGLEEEKGIQIILLDGEEAWVSWTDTDSLYGARALAQSWEAEIHPDSIYKTGLSSISLFLLIDLLGAPNPRIPSYFPSTHWAYRKMAKIEQRMRELGVLETKPKRPFMVDKDKESVSSSRGYVLDDHVPFMERGVEILHIIPTPFPDVWHQITDDGDHLDLPTVRDWARIITVFAAEWMEVDAYLPKKTEAEMIHDPTDSRTEL
ncbi:Glutaminyl-peptide cyclotransferase-like protein [Colletotrichum orbiculare MAFF 240422]|uniref:Peptide hydrolase n=1 Tax=Colletotrichum orbiculare (strain 104-T / ATCC 96160 / CBS 514.97 / LARS 414 / MAFF 240422) TaxID=1213857 RepID=N4VD35_COLOR|nr:Glutaminyl-peptide cyclotransferase-like protein [Colletotrichum orbiculare MAFF 240422]